jgi:hypothetical protein
MAASKGGHDDKIGGNVRVIKFQDDGAFYEPACRKKQRSEGALLFRNKS